MTVARSSRVQQQSIATTSSSMTSLGSVRKQLAAMGDHVERALEEMHLDSRGGLRARGWPTSGTSTASVRVFASSAPLLGIQAPLRGHHMDKRHRASPPVGCRHC